MTNFGWHYPPGVSDSDFEDPPVEMEDCERCDGQGEYEIQIGGDDNGYGAAAALADVPCVCEECEGTGRVEV
jgi:hypothetical protein